MYIRTFAKPFMLYIRLSLHFLIKEFNLNFFTETVKTITKIRSS